jgi:broad specificity phosphatase PhoE
MVRLYLVRHGKAAASFAEAHDPGLHPDGVAQAEALAERLAPLGPLPIVTSPLKRTRETAAPLERCWRFTARIEPAVGEIPAPTDDPAARSSWLRGVLTSRWAEQPENLLTWRRGVADALLALARPTVVVTHFVAINAAVGIAEGDDRVVGFEPDNCSVTVLDVEDGALRLVRRGVARPTQVL